MNSDSADHLSVRCDCVYEGPTSVFVHLGVLAETS